MKNHYLQNIVTFSTIILINLLINNNTFSQTNRFWSGNSPTNDNIDQGSNWYGGVNPSSGDNLYFDNTGTRHWAYSNYGAGSYFNWFITYNGAGGIKLYGDNTYAYKFENNNDGSLLELSPSSALAGDREIGNRINNDLEINPVGTGGILVSCDKISIDNLNGTRNLKVYGNNTLTINGSIYEKNGAGAAFQILNAATVELKGNSTYTGLTSINGGILKLNAAGGALNSGNAIAISGGTLQVMQSQTIGNLTMSSGTTLQVDAGSTLTINGTLTIGGSVTITGGGTIAYGTSGTLVYAQTTNSLNYTIGNEWPLSGGPHDVTINLTGSGSPVINLSSGRFLNGILTLTNGVIKTGLSILNVNGTSGGSGTSYVDGKLALAYFAIGSKTFPIGKDGVYAPITYAYVTSPFSSSVTAELYIAPMAGTLPAGTTLYSGHYWKVIESGPATAAQHLVTLNDVGFSPSTTAVMLRGDGVTNTAHAVTYASPNYTNATSFTTFSGFTNFGLGQTTLPAAYNVTGGGEYCQGSGGSSVGLDGSQMDVDYQLYSSSTPVGSVVPGTGSTLNFGLHTAGVYTVKGTNAGGTTIMTGSATIVENPLPSAPANPVDQTICSYQSIPALTVTVGAGETADWYAASAGGTALVSGIGTTSYIPAAAGTYYAEARNTTTGCLSSSRTPVTLTINTCNKVTITNGDWNTAGTWSGTSVPVAGDDVTINHVVTLTGNGDCHDLTINTGKSLTVNPGGSLIPNGSVTGDINVELTIPGGGETGFHLFCLPISGYNQAASSLFNGAYLDRYDEPSGAWIRLQDANPVISLKGYSINYATSKTLTFTGPIYTSNQTFGSLGYTSPAAPGYGSGWHLVGNPFTSAVATTSGTWASSDLGAYIHVWDVNAHQFWTTSIIGGGGTLLNDIIPAMQGFFVHATTDGASITVPEAARIHSSQTFYKSDDVINNALFLTVEGNGYKDKAIVAFNPEATTGFDSQYDAYKLMGGDAAPQLYSILPGDIATVNTLPLANNELVPLGLKVGAATTYTLSISGMESFDPNTPIRLDDLKLGTSQDVRLNPTYSFTAAPGDAENRFQLRFTSAYGIDETAAGNFSIFAAQRQVHIVPNTPATGKVYVYSATGQLVATAMLNSGETLLSINAPGVYLVKVVTDKAVTSGKVVIN